MANRLRHNISKKLHDIAKLINPSNEVNYNLSSKLELKLGTNSPELHMPFSNIFPKHIDNDLILKEVLSIKSPQEGIEDININKSSEKDYKLIFKLNSKTFISDILSQKQKHHEISESSSQPQRFAVEFSSPNIAKPFHVGHLRSTIIGNFISNLHKYLNNYVTRINYLGDWGTQFGYVKVGMDMTNITHEEFQRNPIVTLYNAYVAAHKLSETDPSISDKARSCFYDLENDNFQDIEKWKIYRKYTVEELEKTYQRLGVTFDVYDWESNYKKNYMLKILTKLEDLKLIEKESDGKQIIIANNRRVALLKSDGTTLYLTRDIAAIEDRHEKYKFDKFFYVVDNGQTDHFKALESIGKSLHAKWADKITHVKFGRIKRMSTRKGNVVFLKNILDEARDIMIERQIQSQTTKIDVNKLGNKTADILGISAVIINDLKQRRQRDYEFDWNKAIQVTGDSGIKLQYTHCRLCNLIKLSGAIEAKSVDPQHLQEREAMALILELGRFPEIICKSQETLEACVLVNYLFTLCNAISKALKVLNVKQEKSVEIQSNRLLLFSKSKEILYTGMTILGLQPLKEM